MSCSITPEQFLALMDELLSHHRFLDDAWHALYARLQALEEADVQANKDQNEWEETDRDD